MVQNCYACNTFTYITKQSQMLLIILISSLQYYFICFISHTCITFLQDSMYVCITILIFSLTLTSGKLPRQAKHYPRHFTLLYHCIALFYHCIIIYHWKFRLIQIILAHILQDCCFCKEIVELSYLFIYFLHSSIRRRHQFNLVIKIQPHSHFIQYIADCRIHTYYKATSKCKIGSVSTGFEF